LATVVEADRTKRSDDQSQKLPGLKVRAESKKHEVSARQGETAGEGQSNETKSSLAVFNRLYEHAAELRIKKKIKVAARAMAFVIEEEQASQPVIKKSSSAQNNKSIFQIENFQNIEELCAADERQVQSLVAKKRSGDIRLAFLDTHYKRDVSSLIHHGAGLDDASTCSDGDEISKE